MAPLALTAVHFRLPLRWNQPPISQVLFSRHVNLGVSVSPNTGGSRFWVPGRSPFRRLLYPCGGEHRHLSWPISAVNPGLEASITDQKKNDISLNNVKVVVESRDGEKIHVRVDLTAEETQRAFDDVLVNLARTAPPIPGFRRKKGGKTSNVPKSFLLQILGRDRVTKFLIQEIVSTSIGDYVKKENLKVKSQFKTTQTADELEAAFTPGNEFGFNATMEIDKPEKETVGPSSS